MIVPALLSQQLIRVAALNPKQEVCGLLFGTIDRLENARVTQNVASDPTCTFEIDPVDLISAHRAMREGGPELIGVFHSHPNGVAEPSVVDSQHAVPDGQIWFIIAAMKITAWQAVPNGLLHGRFDPVVILPC